MQMPKLKNLFVIETCLRFCAIDLQISFLTLAIASKKISKNVSESCAKWLQIGAVSESWGLAFSVAYIVLLLSNLLMTLAPSLLF